MRKRDCPHTAPVPGCCMALGRSCWKGMKEDGGWRTHLCPGSPGLLLCFKWCGHRDSGGPATLQEQRQGGTVLAAALTQPRCMDRRGQSTDPGLSMSTNLFSFQSRDARSREDSSTTVTRALASLLPSLPHPSSQTQPSGTQYLAPGPAALPSSCLFLPSAPLWLGTPNLTLRPKPLSSPYPSVLPLG